ncbi:sporulation protein YhbH [Paenibacillus hamazuiensis]|uniref:sporulation protein YhbH n=1 Tax=Paenibacillus hamazuiensis TaxID=2936508 RepID=UPI00200D8184|nr:sporulation protein YhbH [Paenibacillus hamazuiensis]
MNKPMFILSHDDWSLHRKGELDQERHKRKVKEAIKQNLADLVSEESIIVPQGDKVVKVPVRSLDEPKFRFDYANQNQVGQGGGGTKPGDVLGRAPEDGQGDGPGKGKQAGDQAGVDYYEAEVTIDELAEIIFEDLQLPRLKPKSYPDMTVDDIHWSDVRRKGMMGNVDKRRTLLESIKRQAMSGEAGGAAAGSIHNDDLRFKTWDDIRKPQSSAVVLAMMDTSGSMGTFEKYIARSFFFWMTRFLRSKYEFVDIRFLAHHTEAKEVSEDEFFHRGESGGTRCSSVYELAHKLVDERFHPQRHNVYAFHFSDGDNFDADNALAVRLATELAERINMLGYGEIRTSPYGSNRLWEALDGIRHPAFVRTLLREKSDVLKTLQAFFRDEIAG